MALDQLKNKIPDEYRKIYRDIKLGIKKYFTNQKRNSRKLFRLTKHERIGSGYHFCILCVKKTVYCQMVVDNINSLHYLNPAHEFTIYCDTLCTKEFDYLRRKFTYPKQVHIINSYNEASLPWQYYKIETLIHGSRQDQILTDADGIWHDDPKIDKDKITLLVIAGRFSENSGESQVIQETFNKPQWSAFNHYVSGFVSIPSKYMNENLEKDLRDFNDAIFTKEKRDIFKRLSEEFAVSLAIQSHYPKDIVTLKK